MKKKISFLFLLFSVVFLCFHIFFFKISDKKFRFYIKKSDNFFDIIKKIEENKNLKSKKTLKITLKILFFSKKIFPGSYVIEENFSIFDFFKNLKNKNQTPIKFCFSNISSKEEFVKHVCEKLDIEEKKLMNKINDDIFLKKYGFNSENILVMFLPDTYEIYWNISEENFLDKMYFEYKKFWNEKRLDLCKKIKLNQIEVSILASIVQKETNKIDEAPKIAGVYMNRIKKKIPLCADPVIKHFLEKNFSVKRILEKDLKIDFKNNTYKYIGIPKEPLCIVKKDYIDSVLNFENHNFLYFCAKEDFSSYHDFSVLYKDHINKSNKYRKALTKQKVYR